MTDPVVPMPTSDAWTALIDKVPIAVIVLFIIVVMLRFLKQHMAETNSTWKEVVLALLKRGKEE